MGLDIRWPVGAMFLLVGAALAAYGWLGDQQIYARSLGINVNLIWGAVLAAFGLLMIALAWHRRPDASGISNSQDIQHDNEANPSGHSSRV